MRAFFISISFYFLLCQSGIGQENFIDLTGTWRFALDSADRGVHEQWYNKKLSQEVELPGSLNEQNIGHDISLTTPWTGSIYDSSYYFHPRLEKYRQPGNLKIPFWLTPLKHYVGPAWYQQEVQLDKSMLNNKLILHLEQPHTETTVWINGKNVGSRNSMVVAHNFDVTPYLRAGKNSISIRVDNRIKEINVGPDSHSLTDHTQGNWNGIIGKIGILQLHPIHFDDIQIYPDIHGRQATIRLNTTVPRAQQLEVRYSAESFNSKQQHRVAPVSKSLTFTSASDTVALTMDMGEDMLLWDEFEPNLYKVTFQLYQKDKLLDEREVTFGMREFKAVGRDFYINGRKTFLRGTCDNAVFPLTGYPPTDEKSWLRIFAKIKEYGLNHVRYHSWCPPEAAFQAADKIGIYLQPEGPSWANHGSSLGNGEPIDQYIYAETNRMAKHFGNYASFCMMAYGNEPRGNQVPYLTAFVNYWKAKDTRRLYTGASVGGSWPVIPNNEFMVRAGARGLDWNRQPESVSDFRDKIAQFEVPFVAHEMGQYCVFPNFDEIKKYTGAYRAKNMELFEEDLRDHHMGDQGKAFLYASGKLQALAYKSEIERALKTPGYSGFQLLSLNDYSGQGTALVGLLDAFWEEKGYITASEFKRFCDTTVLLIRAPKFTFTNDETLRVDVEMAHYGKEVMSSVAVKWRLLNKDRQPYAHGILKGQDIQIGNNNAVGTIEIILDGLKDAQEMKLELLLEGTNISNDWDFYVYPKSLPKLSEEVYYANEINDSVKRVLESGGKVFLNLSGKIKKGAEIVQHYLPVFWNTSWFKMRPPHTLGFILDRSHLAFSSFPTQNYSTIQWWEVVHKAQVMHLEDFPADFRPLMQPIDTWFMNRRLAQIFEAKVGNGKLVVSSADLSDDSKKIVSRQLYHSLINYMSSSSFEPKEVIDFKLVEDLVTKPSKLTFDTYTKSSPDELKPNINEFLQK
ncbi:beta-glucuronidase [Sphingobacterium olei]|uniref:beta-galactosidase n=1 Tax=Sphingobacterium olei TaxID=2571155 RepID=A0A4U0P1S0_9SPHI|nr:sugar-binding domain-containing protein [Sphingobacterium olei]TJZ61113.1 beta-glucuronidase [Sphingobacterium olei]